MRYNNKKKPLCFKNKEVFVLEAGLEPARPDGHRILSPACLPIPPLEQLKLSNTTGLNKKCRIASAFKVERKTGFEPATSTLARWRSTN